MWTAGKVRSVDGRVTIIMVEVLLVRRRVFVVKRIEIPLFVVNFQRDIVGSKESVPFQTITNLSKI